MQHLKKRTRQKCKAEVALLKAADVDKAAPNKAEVALFKAADVAHKAEPNKLVEATAKPERASNTATYR